MKFRKQEEIDKLLDELKEIAGYLWERGWSEKNAGNISILLPDTLEQEELEISHEIKFEQALSALSGKCFYITGSGRQIRDIAKDPLKNGVFIQINTIGDGYLMHTEADTDILPSSELPTHLGIHNTIAQRGSDETVIMHTHATEIIALTHNSKMVSSEDINRILWGMHTETLVCIPKGVGLLPYILPGSQAIADATVKEFEKHDIVVWRKHGIFAIGKSISDTFDTIDIVCKAAKIWLQCKAAGFEPEGLSNKELDELRGLVK